MAYLMRKKQKKEGEKQDGKWTGPFANKAGEFVSNHCLEYAHLQKRTDVRHGKPCVCEGVESAGMERMGFVGLYLTKDLHNIPNSGNPDLFMEVDTDFLHEEVRSGQRGQLKPFNPEALGIVMEGFEKTKTK